MSGLFFAYFFLIFVRTRRPISVNATNVELRGKASGILAISVNIPKRKLPKNVTANINRNSKIKAPKASPNNFSTWRFMREPDFEMSQSLT